MAINTTVDELLKLWIDTSLNCMKKRSNENEGISIQEINMSLEIKGIRNVFIENLTHSAIVLRYSFKGNEVKRQFQLNI